MHIIWHLCHYYLYNVKHFRKLPFVDLFIFFFFFLSFFFLLFFFLFIVVHEHLTLASNTYIIGPRHNKTKKVTVRPAKTDQPGHPPSLIRVFAVRLMGSKGPKLLSCGQQRL